MSVRCVLSGKFLCDVAINHQRSPTERCVSECDGEASTLKMPWPIWGSRSMENNNGQVNEHSESIRIVMP
jgi:hypothetical protein